MSGSPYESASEERLAEIVRLAEARLEAQLTVALAADARAMTMAGILAGIVSALIAWTAASDLAGAPEASRVVLLIGLALSMGCALWSASPIEWDLPGNTPASWLEEINDGASIHSDLADMAAYYDGMISDNRRRLRDAANTIRAAWVIGSVSVIVSGVLAAIG